ncbi:F0F1 ATP synthase subunit delta [Patescibacteria group bacterium]|nr:F0F1 ATP synthase subunit delta [Patescibacteria group bacterium]MCL5114744.1 F0F1 ATP synthase subunit delta [Patescibacteria group bacterium]
MKIPSKLYAKVFSEVTKGKSPEEIKKMAERLAGLIDRNGDAGRKEEILKFAERYARELRGKHLLNVETARELPDHFYEEIAEKLGKGKYDIEKHINEELVAGAKLTVDDERELDMTLRTILKNLFNTKEK